MLTSDFATLQARADRVSKEIVERARAVAREAGLSPEYPFLHAHNAMVCAYRGKPWRGVDYDLVRKVLWLQGRSFLPYRLLSQWYRRATAGR